MPSGERNISIQKKRPQQRAATESRKRREKKNYLSSFVFFKYPIAADWNIILSIHTCGGALSLSPKVGREREREREVKEESVAQPSLHGQYIHPHTNKQTIEKKETARQKVVACPLKRISFLPSFFLPFASDRIVDTEQKTAVVKAGGVCSTTRI